MGVTVTFNSAAFQQRYPEFANIDEGLLTQYAAEAQAYHANDGSGPVGDPTLQLVYLNMVTAHIAQLYKMRDTEKPASELVGRISDATQGSVSVSAEMAPATGSSAWWMQTKYGASYWEATRQFRTMVYRAPRPRFPQHGGWPWRR